MLFTASNNFVYFSESIRILSISFYDFRKYSITKFWKINEKLRILYYNSNNDSFFISSK